MSNVSATSICQRPSRGCLEIYLLPVRFQLLGLLSSPLTQSFSRLHRLQGLLQDPCLPLLPSPQLGQLPAELGRGGIRHFRLPQPANAVLRCQLQVELFGHHQALGTVGDKDQTRLLFEDEICDPEVLSSLQNLQPHEDLLFGFIQRIGGQLEGPCDGPPPALICHLAPLVRYQLSPVAPQAAASLSSVRRARQLHFMRMALENVRVVDEAEPVVVVDEARDDFFQSEFQLRPTAELLAAICILSEKWIQSML